MSLPEELKAECTGAFEIFTKDTTNGKLGPDELNKVLRMLGQSPSDEEIQEIIRDFAEEETMTLDEFLDFMTRQLSGSQDKREEDLSKEFKLLLKETFHWYDKDADGIISWDELKKKECPRMSAANVKYPTIATSVALPQAVKSESTGYLSMALKNTGEVIQDWEVDEMMRDGDENADKLIDFDEWINMMKELEGQIKC